MAFILKSNRRKRNARTIGYFFVGVSAIMFICAFYFHNRKFIAVALAAYSIVQWVGGYIDKKERLPCFVIAATVFVAGLFLWFL